MYLISCTFCTCKHILFQTWSAKCHTKNCPGCPPAMCSSLSVRLVELPLSALSVKGAVVAPLPAWFQFLNPS